MFDKRLKKLRTDKELSQKVLSDILGISPSTVAMYEQGRRTPDNEMLSKIADFFEVSLDYLLGRTEDTKSKIYSSIHNGDKIEIEVNKDYPHELTPDEVKELIDNLNEVGFDVDKLIEKVKNKGNKKD